jgi:hypothetical protein
MNLLLEAPSLAPHQFFHLESFQSTPKVDPQTLTAFVNLVDPAHNAPRWKSFAALLVEFF